MNVDSLSLVVVAAPNEHLNTYRILSILCVDEPAMKRSASGTLPYILPVPYFMYYERGAPGSRTSDIALIPGMARVICKANRVQARNSASSLFFGPMGAMQIALLPSQAAAPVFSNYLHLDAYIYVPAPAPGPYAARKCPIIRNGHVPLLVVHV